MPNYVGQGTVWYNVGDTFELSGRQYQLTDAGWRRISQVDGTLQPLTPREAKFFKLAKAAADRAVQER